MVWVGWLGIEAGADGHGWQTVFLVQSTALSADFRNKRQREFVPCEGKVFGVYGINFKA